VLKTALPPGPAFGAASAKYEKCILDDGPSTYIRTFTMDWGFKKATITIQSLHKGEASKDMKLLEKR